ncbi:nuclear transport factor 2 family protein [Thalassotalea sp. PS06]|uniref:nuclear transport factor 2 family protein n=1 Tax=Thalassotalea sp. PS06 TaxID=2594005 RepID=UPI0011637F51|nr:nuclear transport factor 2 family protein [Thalassotalea sp. PS06]QDP00995.1 nuclear transport factor 2 family protein [Thalassotalea sp. PS06]
MYKLLALFIFLPFVSFAENIELVEKFIQLTDATKVKGASQKDIDKVAALLGDDMRYQHPNFNADLTKAQFIEGLSRYLGAVDAMDSVITTKIVGSDAITVAFISTTINNGKTDIDERPLMRLFEFNQGKIALVKEYW